MGLARGRFPAIDATERLSGLPALRLRRWRRASLTTKTALVLVFALGPMAISILFLGVLNEQDAVLDRRITAHRELRLIETEILKNVVDADTAVRGFLLTGDDPFLDPFDEAQEALPGLIRRLEMVSGPGGIATAAEVQKIRGLVGRQMKVLTALVGASYNEDALHSEKAGMDEFRAVMGEETAEHDSTVAALLDDREGLTGLARSILIGGGLVSAMAAFLGGLVLMRGVVQRVKVLTENARRLTNGEEFLPFGNIDENDEIAQLAARLKESAQMLRARESDLRLAKAEADAANAAKSEFLSRMSHELRTPLNAILGFAEVARAEVKGEPGKDLDQIHLAGRHLLALINEVLDIARIEAGELSMSMEPVALSGVIDEAVTLLSGAAQARSIEMKTELGGGDIYVRADRQRLKQVMVNLLSNAVKYNRTGGEVRVVCARTDKGVEALVADTGPGLPKSATEDAFKPFARLGAETTDIEGTGLGLAVTKSLMQAMEGDVEVASTGSKGTEFRLYLEASDAPTPKLDAAPVPAPTEIATRRVAGRVLQVEDNPSNIRLVTRIMQRRPGVDLITAQYGEEAVMLAKELQPNLVLLDLNLPDMSGRDVLARLRAEPETRDLRVVMLSADATESQIANLLNLGAHDYLTKPIDVRALLQTVDDAMGLRETG